MAADAIALPAGVFGISVPKVWSPPLSRSLFGDIVLVVFLLSQCFDGVFTYIGVMTYGHGIEANPLILGLMLHFGQGAALAGAKIAASFLGICLHLRRLHSAVALLSGFYLAVAILPWTAILFF